MHQRFSFSSGATSAASRTPKRALLREDRNSYAGSGRSR